MNYFFNEIQPRQLVSETEHLTLLQYGSLLYCSIGTGGQCSSTIVQTKPDIVVNNLLTPGINRSHASGLNTAAVAAGKVYFGTATDNPELTDTAYVTQLNNTNDFGQITPGNSQKVFDELYCGIETYSQQYYSGMQLNQHKTPSPIPKGTRLPTSLKLTARS